MFFQKFLHIVESGKELSEEEMMGAMTEIMDGKVGDTQLAAFLTALQFKNVNRFRNRWCRQSNA